MLEWIKSHPIPAALTGVGLFLVFYLMLRGGGSGSAGGVQYVPVQTGPSDAVQQAQIAASLQMNQTNAAAQATANQTQAQYNLGVLQTQLEAQAALAGIEATNLQTSTAGDVSLAGIDAQRSVQEAGIAAGVQTNATDVQGQVLLGNISAQSADTINQQNQQTQQDQINTQAMTAKENLDAETSMYNRGAALQENLATTNYNLQTGLATIGSNLQTSLASTSADLQKYVTGTAANLAGSEFDTNATLQSHLSDNAAGIVNNQTAATLATNLANTDLTGYADSLNAGLDTLEVNKQSDLNAEYLNLLGTDAAAAAAYKTNTTNTVLNLISSGTLNKGGEGGANQVAAVSSVLTGAAFNPYPTATASLSGGNSFGGILSGFANLFSSVGKGIAGGLKA